MGAGIAQIALEAGDEVLLHDVDEAAITRATDRVRDGLTRRAAGMQIDPGTIDAWVDARLARLRAATTLDQVGAEADVVIEAAIESLDLKRMIFGTLDAAAPAATILATNTSALSIAAIAAAAARPARVVDGLITGWHEPGASHLLLLEAVAGPDLVAAAYRAAAAHGYLWHEFGDSVLLLPD